MTKSNREIALVAARAKLYSIAGGSHDSGDPRASRLTLRQRIAFIDSPEFRDYIAAERAAGIVPFWKKDVDKTQGAGDVFTHMFSHRADNDMFTPQNLKAVSDYLRKRSGLKKPRSRTSRPTRCLRSGRRMSKAAKASR